MTESREIYRMPTKTDTSIKDMILNLTQSIIDSSWTGATIEKIEADEVTTYPTDDTRALIITFVHASQNRALDRHFIVNLLILKRGNLWLQGIYNKESKTFEISLYGLHNSTHKERSMTDKIIDVLKSGHVKKQRGGQPRKLYDLAFEKIQDGEKPKVVYEWVLTQDEGITRNTFDQAMKRRRQKAKGVHE